MLAPTAFFLALLFALAACGPCDIYAFGNTPCVCAHSTVRALFNGYQGRLYEVRRENDGARRDIGTLTTGGPANATAQDEFCAGRNCIVSVIYDQTGRNNHLTVGTPGGANPRGNTPAKADREAITLRGTKVYSLYTLPGEGYFHDGSNQGIPRGNEPGGIYMVTSGTHVNDGCCFDYGNGESNRHDNGASHMNALYFGTAEGPKGQGPWVMADLENGLFSGGSRSWNPQQRGLPFRFVTAMEKNNGVDRFALKGSNAQAGTLETFYDGALPRGYAPMKQEGGIILGTGGDDSSWSEGTFYEGAMVRGFPADNIEDAVQKDIISAGYGL